MCFAVFSEGITEGLNWLIDCLKRNIETRPPRSSES
jgi:hypothetical protein